MTDYDIYKEGNLQAVRYISVFDDPKVIKYTIVGTLHNSADDIGRRGKILYRILSLNPEILKSYLQLDPKTPLLENYVHTDLLKTLIDLGANYRFSDEYDRILLAAAVQSEMCEAQLHSLCSYLINDHKAYDIFSNNGDINSDIHNPGDWICPVPFMLFSKKYTYLDTLEMIFYIPGFDINQTCPVYQKEKGMSEMTLFQIANHCSKGLVVYKLMVEKGADYKIKFPHETTPLMYASLNNDEVAAEYYLSLGFSVKDKDIKGATPMSFAWTDVKMVEFFKSKRAELSEATEGGNTVFHFAALLGKSESFCEFVTYFATQAPEVQSKFNKENQTPLNLRIRKCPEDWKGIELLEQLIAYQDNQHDKGVLKIISGNILLKLAEYEIFKTADLSSVQMICAFEDPKVLKYTIVGTLENGIDEIKQRVSILCRIFNLNPIILKLYLQLERESPLLEKHVHVDLLKSLIENGASIRVADRKGRNLLAVAADFKMSESQFQYLCDYLINTHKAYDLFSKRGKFVGKCELKGDWNSPVFTMLYQIEYAYIESIKLIFNIPGFDITQTAWLKERKCDFTMFQWALIWNKGLDVYKLMVERGADYKRKFEYKRTALMEAALFNDVKNVEYFVSLGFSMHDKCYFGATPIHYACGDLEKIEYLKFQGADLSVIDKEGNCILHNSAKVVESGRFCEFVVFFNTHAPEVINTKNNFGCTPLDMRKSFHSDDNEGIKLLEQVIAIKGKQDKESGCTIS